MIIRAKRRRTEGHASVETVMPIRYQDRYVRTDEGWKFVHRFATVQWTSRREL